MGSKKARQAPKKRSEPPTILKWTPLTIIIVGLTFCLFLKLKPQTQKAELSQPTLKKETLTPSALGSVKKPIPLRYDFQNGDFQSNDASPWFYLDNVQWGPFKILKEESDGKENSFARVNAFTAPPATSVKVFGAVQEWQQDSTIPPFLNFNMRVMKEQKLCSKQYAQAVVIFTKSGVEKQIRNLQLRIILHGAEKAPYNMSNAKFYMNPEFTIGENKWRHYSLPILSWFKESFPNTPDNHWQDGVFRVLLEARYDTLPISTPMGTSVLVVDYDDVSFTETEKK